MINFYRAFEDRHRGGRELIKSRLAAYLPFLAPLSSLATPPTALDLGCGRGEWLELLGEHGFSAHGVDLDDGMLAACRERGLNVATSDALSALRAQPDASLTLVSAFHLVEHIPFGDVHALIEQALRVLRPGGLMILETPNPENLVVGASNFYTDPSHLRPIPPLLLDFAVEFAGFARHKIVRLQEAPALHTQDSIELINVLNGVSPDYSIVAQKSAELTVTAAFDAAFATPFGLDLGDLAQRYQAQEVRRDSEFRDGMARLNERVAAAEAGNQALFQRTLETVGEAQSVSRLALAELHEVQHRLALKEEQWAAREAQAVLKDEQWARKEAQWTLKEEQWALKEEQWEAERLALAEQQASERHSAEQQASAQQAAEALLQAEQARAHADAQLQHVTWQLNEMTVRAQAAERAVQDLYASSSWRMTRPARAAASLLLRRAPGAGDAARAAETGQRTGRGNVLMPLVRRLARHPGARTLAMRTLARFPALEGRVRALTYRALHGAPAYAPPAVAADTPALPGQPPAAMPSDLSHSARKALAQLQRSAQPDDQQPN